MNYLHKILLIALTATPFLVGMEDEGSATKDEHKVKIQLPAGTRLADDNDMTKIQSITCCQFLTPDVALFAEQLGVTAKIERLGLLNLAEQWGLFATADFLRLPALAQRLYLPALAKSLGFFKDEIAAASDKRIWTKPLLEKLNWGQLLQLAKTFEIGLDELLMFGLRNALLPKQKTD
ncbi:MAG: hypothetical protein ACK4V2_00220 [Pseudomonadota bacterium]|jgi:hypothetical protein|nr:hypothetical protein [Alphaproteobacteria bacterium]